eukprot:Gb_20773 [translate_table: standard]
MARTTYGKNQEKDNEQNGATGSSSRQSYSNEYWRLHASTNADREPGEISPSEADYAKQDHFTPPLKKTEYSPIEIEPRRPLESLESQGRKSPFRPRHLATSRWADSGNSLGDATFVEDGRKGRKASLSADSHQGRFESSEPNGGKIMFPIRKRTTSLDNDAGQDIWRSSREEFKQNFRRDEPIELEEVDISQVDNCKQLPVSESSATPLSAPRSSEPPNRMAGMLQGCRDVNEFEKLNKIDEGTFGVVYRARNKKSGEIVALKKVKMEKGSEIFPITSLREINLLLSIRHPSIVDLKEVVVGSKLDQVFMVMEYMEHDLRRFMETTKQPFSQSEVKCLMLQLLEGVNYLHDNWILHRDLKMKNLLLNNRGEVKICDFGLARPYGSPLKTYTNMVVTLWYRPPELLLGAKKYSIGIDMWSLGCIMAELLANEPLFPGRSEIDQLDKIFGTLGTPNENIWPDFVNLPGVKCRFVKQPYNKLREKFPAVSFSGRPTLSESGFDLLSKLLTYDPNKRITSEEALRHEWFREVPLPQSKELMPTYPAQSDQDRCVLTLRFFE